MPYSSQSARTRARLQRIRDERIRAMNLANREFANNVDQFESKMRSLEFESCHVCRKQCWLGDVSRTGCSICTKAQGDSLFSAENGMDLGEIPIELQGLTMIEQLLIARVHPVVSVFAIRGRQTAYSGHTMNFVQHIEEIATRLPHNISSMTTVILLNRNTPHGLTQFRVRAAVVRRALVWLRSHNQYYSDIIIDEQNMGALPDDGDVVDMLPAIPNPPASNQEEPVDGEVHNNLIDSSGYPNLPAVDAANAIDRDLQSLRGGSQPQQLEDDWPEVDRERINEFSTEGLICKAFPVLFPYGRGDLHAPRLRTITNHNYFKYLMDYHDGRFANDLRFPYYAYNTLARWDALNCGNTFVRLNDMGNLTNEDFRQMVNDPNTDIASRIMYHGATLRGTRAFWKQRCSELTEMVRQLGTPTIFFTLSAADYHWPDLFRLLRPDNDGAPMTEQQRASLMHDNPMITAKFFNERCLIFMKKFMQVMFPIKDFWYRFEWQHRGSPHIHGLLWLEDAPDCDNIANLDEDARTQIVDYFDKLVFATIENRTIVPLRENPCRARYTDLTPGQRANDLDKLLSAVQTHSRCGPHCMRKRRGSSVLQCRYKFPIQLEEESCLRYEEGSWKFIPKRNDQLLQRHNRFISQAWRGNTDFSPITSKDAVLKYISKYASKGEFPSEAYNDILKRLVNTNTGDSPTATLVRQLIVSSVAERNYSAQEVMHLLMGWPLYHATRTFVILSTNERWQRLGGTQPALTRLYAQRDFGEDMTLFQCAQKYRIAGGQLVVRQKECIVRVIPYMQITGDPTNDNEYYKAQCKIHIPWRGDFHDMLPENSSWEEYYFDRILEPEVPIEFPEAEQVEFEDAPLDHAQIVRDAGMAAARLHPGVAALDPLGHRPIDEAYQWKDMETAQLSEQDITAFYTGLRQAGAEQRQRSAALPFESFSPDQRAVLELCSHQLQNPDHPLKRVIVQGKAGTGKSAVIKYMCQLMDAHSVEGQKIYEVLAPTGAAALNVDGKTIHSYFSLPTSSNITDLNGEGLRRFQLKLQHLKFLIIDEYSMVGLRLFAKIHKRLRQAFPNQVGPFANINIYLFGDLRQLPPVMDIPIYMEPRDNFSRLASMDLISSIQKRIELSVCHRQDADQVAFKNCLDNLAAGTATRDGWQLLMTRRSSLTPANRATFKDAIHLFPTNAQVSEHNSRILSSNLLPVAPIDAISNNVTASHGDDSNAQGLAKTLYLSLGCRIMLRKNLDVSRGLVNGTLGTVREIIYRPGELPPSLPRIIMVEFDNYAGPFIRDRSYPLIPTVASWTERGVDCTRKQFPINLAYALTIHKSQGLTLQKAIIDIGPKEASPGLTYVALSRVKRIEDLILNSFDFTRLSKIGEMSHVRARERFLREMNIPS